MSGSLYLAWTDASGTDRRLYFDCAESLGVEGVTAITDNPVERGANITDHARSVPTSLTMSVFVSNSPIADRPDGSLGSSRGPTTLSIPRYVIDGRTGVGFGSPRGRGIVIQESQSVMLFREGNFVQETYDALEELREANQLLTVGTGYKLFTDMLLSHVKPAEDAESGDGMSFALTLKKVRIVASELVNVPLVPEGKTTVAKGKQDPQASAKATTQSSVAKGILNQLPDSVKSVASGFLGIGG